jgi:hypothetical protein
MNQYRCETCKHNGNRYCEVFNYRLNSSEIDTLEVFGCVSHSDFKSEREKVLDELKRDLKTRFISSSNQWSKGRNSGLLECCNIIDEYLRQKAGEP